MKISTDACLFGAFVDVPDVQSILDIGTGTGLLALMLAQKNNAAIDAVEIDDAAFQQAPKNSFSSPWKDRITVYHADISEWAKKSRQKFDLIISNPPFFSNHYKSEKEERNLAKHTDSLTQKGLLNVVLQLLNKNTGIFYLMLPPKEMESFIALAFSKKLFSVKKILIRNFKGSKVFRIISSFSFSPSDLETDEIIIWDSKEKYSTRFMELLHPYYLYL